MKIHQSQAQLLQVVAALDPLCGPIRTPMMAITTNNSIREKPARLRLMDNPLIFLSWYGTRAIAQSINDWPGRQSGGFTEAKTFESW
jgi:hypothetical protein